MNKIFLILFFFTSICFSKELKAQKNYDSLDIAKELISNGDNNKALVILNQLNKKYSENHDTIGLINVIDLYTEIFQYDTSANNETKFLLQKILLLKSYIKNKYSDSLELELFNTYLQLAEIYQKNKEYNTSLDLLLRMLIIAQKNENYKLIAKTYYYIANNYKESGNYINSISYIKKSIRTARETGDSSFVAQYIIALSDFLYEKNSFAEALNNLFYTLNIAELEKNNYIKFQCYARISKIFFKLKFFDKALIYSQKSLSAIENINLNKLSNANIIEVYILIAENYYSLGNYLKAEQYLHEATYKIIDKTDFKTLAKIEYLLGKVYTKEKKFSKAKQSISKSFYLSQKISDTKGIALSFLNFANFYKALNEKTLEKYYAQKALDISLKYNYYQITIESSFLLYQIYKYEKKYSKALEYLEKYNNASIILQKQNEIISVEKLEVEKQYRKQTQYNKEKLNYLKKEKQKLIIFSSFLAFTLILVIILVIIILRRNKVVKRQKELIEKQKAIIFKQYEKYKLLSLVASHTNNSIFIMDTNWKIKWINEALLKLYKTSDYEIFTINNGDFRKLTKQDIDLIYKTCILQHKSLSYIAEFDIDNDIKYIQTTITPIIENGRANMLIGIELDITELKKAEIEIKKQKKDIEFKNKLLEIYNQELKQQKEAIVAQNEELQQQQEELQTHMELLEEYNKELLRLSVIARETDNVIYIFDITGKLIWVNEAFTKHTGYTLAEFIEQKGDNIILASTVPNIEYYFFTCVEQKKSVTYVSDFVTKYGKKRWLQTTLTPIKDEDGNVKEIVAIDSDITEIKNAEQKISQQNNEIKSSLEYASLIQRSVLPLQIFFNAVFEKNMIFNKPRDIVSGDFYFLHYAKDKAVFALADCTGHGIPGAFLSLLGTMALKLIMSKIESFSPNIILNMLNDELIKLLHQRGKRSDTMDSMDMALCVFDFKENTLEYSGANIPLFISRINNKGEIHRIKPTKATIGFDMLRESFTVHSFKMNPGDRIYVTSDGLSDQFGGKANKKLKRRGLTELILSLDTMPIEEQYSALEKFLNEWMGPNDQNDDILFISLEF